MHSPVSLSCILLDTFVSIAMSMVKRFLPQNIKDKLQFGCQFDSRLDQCLLTPDVTTAQARTYSRIIETLQIRYENEANFRL